MFQGQLFRASPEKADSDASAERPAGSFAMWAVAAQLATIYVLSTAPTPLYVIYLHEFGFSEIILTLIYAAYVVGTVAAMFLLGRLSDQVGRRPVVLISLGVAAVGAVIFLVARHTAWLFPARIVSGLAIALASGASTAWILELEPQGQKFRATRIAVVANLVGLAAGSAIAGVMAQFMPWPLGLVYIVFLAMLVPVFWVTWRVPQKQQELKPLRDVSMRPRIGVPRELRARFFTPAVAALAIFSVMGFYTALIPSLVTKALHNQNHATAGAIVAELFFLGVMAVAVLPQLSIRSGLFWPLVLLIPSVVLLVIAQAMHSMVILLIATAIAGVATSVGYQYGLEAVNALSPEDKRSEIISMYLIFCYAGVSLPVIGISVLSQWTGPLIADCIFAGIIILLVIAAMIPLNLHNEGN